MKSTLPAALVLSCLLAGSALAAEKNAPKKKGGTLPSTSKMIVIPPSSDPAVTTGAPAKLISSEMSGKDLQFFTTAADAGRFQQYLVGLLQTKAESEQIKALGAALAETQEEENRQIAKLAGIKGWTVPTQLTPSQKTAGAALEKQSGSDFDKAAMDQLISASQQTLTAYEAAGQSTDGDIKNFADHMLPLAKERQLLVEKMTGAGKAAKQLLRGGGPPKAPAEAKPIAPPITK